MPVPVLAVVPTVIGAIAKVGSKIGGFFKKLFGGKKKRRAARLAAKQQRIEDSSKRVLAEKVAKLELAANVGEAKARVKLAQIERQLARQGISFDPGVQDATLSDLGIRIPQIFNKVRNPQVFQQGQLENVGGTAIPLQASVAPFNLGTFFSKPMNLLIVAIGLLIVFGRRIFK